MKLPWDKNYFKVSLYVVFTVLAIYISKLAVDGIVYIITNFSGSLSLFVHKVSNFLALFSPLITGLIIAYLLDSPVEFFQKKFDNLYEKKIAEHVKKFKFRKKRKPNIYKKRVAGTLITYICLIAIIFFIVFAFAKNLGNDASGNNNLKNSVQITISNFENVYSEIETKLDEIGVLEYVSKHLTKLISYIGNFIATTINSVINNIAFAGTKVLNFVISAVIAFYFLSDKNRLVSLLKEYMYLFLKEKTARKIEETAGRIHYIFYGYIRGVLTDAVIVAVLVGSWLSIVGVKFSLLIGLITGFSNVIPYIGAFIGFLLAIVMALLTGEPKLALLAGIGILVIQQVDGLFIQPKVVGNNVELSPVFVILSLSIAGNLFGVAGMILAVPVCAVIKMFLAEFVRKKKLRTES